MPDQQTLSLAAGFTAAAMNIVLFYFTQKQLTKLWAMLAPISSQTHINKESNERLGRCLNDEIGAVRSYVQFRFKEHEQFHKPVQTPATTPEIEEAKCMLEQQRYEGSGYTKDKRKVGRPRKN